MDHYLLQKNMKSGKHVARFHLEGLIFHCIRWIPSY